MTTEALRPFIPDLLERQLHATSGATLAPWEDRVEAAVLVADITGFTALTERLATRGPAGAELLTDIVNARFGPIIDLVRGHGGDVVKFAGDATFALFPSDGASALGDAVARAAAVGLAIQRALAAVPASEGAPIRARVGIAAGRVWTGGIGGAANRWEYLAGGPPVADAARAAARAAPGDVVATAEAWHAGQDALVGTAIGDGCMVVTGAVSFPLMENAPVVPSALPEALLRPFVPRALAERLAAGHSRWLAEFRRVTVAFVGARDVAYDGPGALARVQDVIRTLQEVVYRYDGSVNQVVMDDHGTTLVAAWGLPSFTHEDDAARGLEAADAMVAALARLGIAATAGVATGRVFTGIRGNAARREYAMLGDTMNLAARLMQAWAGVLTDEATARAAAPRVACDPQAPITLKGKSLPVAVFRPRGEEAPAAELVRVRRALFGRQEEQARVAERLDALRTRSEGGVLIVEGEAGIGKSNLLAHLVDQARARDVQCLVGEADAIEQSTAYFVWRRPLLGLFDGGGEREALVAAVGTALSGNATLAERAPLLNAVLPLDLPETAATAELESQVRADALRDLVVQLLSHAAAGGPIVVVLDDCHWIDSGSWTLALAAARRVPGLLLVIGTRPMADAAPLEYRQLLREPRAERLALGPLDSEDALALVRGRLGVSTLPREVAALIASKAEGNPFFSEQLAYELRDSGHLVIENGDCRLAPHVTDLAALGVPDTVQGVVTGRIDRLSPSEQLTLKVASVIGRTFQYRLLSEVYPVEADRPSLKQHLERLTALDLTMLEAPDPDLAYLFKHVIAQEVAYDLLAFAQRRTLHRAVAEWYEANAGDLEPHLPLLAHHWSRAEVVQKSLQYLGRAGGQALQLHGNAEAVRFFAEARALDAAHGHPAARAARADWERGTAIALVKLSRYVESHPHFEESLRLLGRPAPRGRVALAADIVRQLVIQLWHRLRPRRSRPARPEALVLSEAHRYLTEVSYWRNDFLRLVHHNLVSLNLAETTTESKELVTALASLGFLAGLATLHGVGRYYRRLADEAGARVGNPDAVGYALELEAVYRLVIGDWDGARDAADRGARVFEQVGDRMRWHTCFSLRGYGYLHQGYFEAARPFFADGLRAIGPEGAVQARIWSLAALLATDLARDQRDLETVAELEALLGPGVHHSDEILVHGLLAITRWRDGDRKAALAHAEAATPLIHRFPPASWHTLLATAYVAELYLDLLEREPEHASEHRREASRAVDGMWRFARLNGAATPRAWLLRGRLAWLTGRALRAERLWQQALDHALRLDMPHEAALAHLALARALPPDDAAREGHLADAEALLAGLGAARDAAIAARLRAVPSS